jgi:hypothetical protein
MMNGLLTQTMLVVKSKCESPTTVISTSGG